MQVYPPKPEDEVPLTRLQERLRKKLGANAYPFKFEVCIVYLRNRRHQIPLKVVLEARMTLSKSIDFKAA